MKVLSYILSPIFILFFVGVLLIFHPLQWLSFRIFGYKGHKFIVDILNFFLVKSLLIIGVPVRLKNKQPLPKNTNFIFVSNHQSIADIPPIALFFKEHHPKFVSKIELGKNIPSVSYNLRHGGAALIDRKDGKQAITALVKFAKNIQQKKWGAIIFPEGTRSRDGKPKKFYLNGLKIICKYNPEAYIVPLTINNSWKVFKYGTFPLGVGSPITITMHKPVKVNSLPFNELMNLVETTITTNINN